MRSVKLVENKGDHRIRTFFALAPVSIEKDGWIETRWLEEVTVDQELKEFANGDGKPELHWETVGFVSPFLSDTDSFE